MSKPQHTALISASGIGVRGQRGPADWIVRGVDVEIGAGEIVTFIGPNGGGKTTTVKCLLGLIEASEGSILRRPGLTIGYVPQKIAVEDHFPLTVARYMSLTQSLPAAETRAALEKTGVAHLSGSAIQNLSGGEFQRVLLARAIAAKPDLLVLDEPVQGVDFYGELALYELIASIRDELGCAILMVSHDLHIVMKQTDRVICINGHICCHGSPGEVSSSETFRSIFGAEAADLITLYRHEHDHHHDESGHAPHGHHDGHRH